MSESFQPIDIIFFAMVAAFLVLRLRSVLGRRTGTEKKRPDPLHREQAEVTGDRRVDAAPDAPVEPVTAGANRPAAKGLVQVKLADRSFEPAGFVAGARKAFEMIVAAFAAGNRDQLRALLSGEVFENFSSAISEREKAGEILETTLVRISSSDIVDAELRDRTAFVTVKFVSQQINVTRSKAGDIVEGDANQATEITDIWTFGRNTQSRDPNWTLVETRSPN